MDPNGRYLDWRLNLHADSRQRILNKIMETMKRHLPFSGNEELKEIALRFEKKMFTVATSQSDYLRKISVKMLALETKSLSINHNTLPSDSAAKSEGPIDPDENDWSPAQDSSGEPMLMDVDDWRTRLEADSRQRIVNKIMETLKRHLPFLGNEGPQELNKIAVRFEEKMYAAATSQSDYLRKIKSKLLIMETKSQSNMTNTPLSSSVEDIKSSIDPGSQGMQSQVNRQGQPLPVSIPTNQSQAGQKVIPQSINNSISLSRVQCSVSLTNVMAPATGLSLNTMPNGVGQNSISQTYPQGPEHICDLTELGGQSMVQGLPSSTSANHSQVQGRQELAPQQQ